MERAGISSACFYPEATEISFLKACKSGVKNVEIFFNAFSELEKTFINELIAIKEYYDASIPSVHPFMSFAEPYFLFSSYERRFHESIDFYKRFFEITNKLGADYFIFHGMKLPGTIHRDLYIERFAKLTDIGKNEGIKVCQENVVKFISENPLFIEQMKNSIGNDFSMVLDIKQARKANFSPYDFIDMAGKHIRHIHISDYNENCVCIPPLEGRFNFPEFFDKLKGIGYDGKFIIELYDFSYEKDVQIYDSLRKINKLLVDY